MDESRHWLSALAVRAYERTPRGADAVLDVVRRHLAPALHHRIPLRRLRGPTADGGTGSVLVAGSGPIITYMTRRFFVGPAEAEALGVTSPLTLKRRLDRLAAAGDDLILARVGRPVASLLLDDRYLRAPNLVGMRIKAGPPDEVLRQARPQLRRNARALRENGLTWSISQDPGDFERFYSDFYRPLALARFGDLAVVEPRWRLRRYLRSGGIRWIQHEGRTLAGQLYEVNGPVLRLVCAGTIGGSPEPRAQGALEATILFAIEHAYQAGQAWVDLGGALPSLRDGPMAHKRQWGGVLLDRRTTHLDLAVFWPSFNQRVARFLQNAPLVIRDGGRLSALAVLDTAEPAEPGAALRLWRQLAPHGLHRFYVVGPNGWRAPMRSGPPPPSEADVRLCDPAPSATVLATARDARSNAG